jgi:hypothetical protein
MSSLGNSTADASGGKFVVRYVLSGHEVRESFLERFGSNTLSFLAPILTGDWEQAGKFCDYLTSVPGLIVGALLRRC